MEFNERKEERCSKCTWNRLRFWAYVCEFLAVGFICVGWFLPPAINDAVNSGIKDSTVLTVASWQNNDQVYRTFASYLDQDAAYVRYSVYMWNITNPREIVLGAKPIIEQVGPYVFREVKQRLNNTFFKDVNGHWIVDHKEWTYYIWEPSMSNGLDLYHDVFTVPNVVYWGVGATLSGTLFSYDLLYSLAKRQAAQNCPYVNQSLPDAELIGSLALQQCALFQSKTANEFMFGFEDPVLNYLKKGRFPGVIVNITESDLAADPSQALHHQMYTGEDDASLSRQYKMFGGTTSVMYTHVTAIGDTLEPLWDTDFANRIYGTDGTQFSRNPPNGALLPAFVSELYRAVQLENVNSETVVFKDITLTRYRLSPNALLNETANPDNAAFHLTEDGVLDVSGPNQNAPIFMTRPHCLYVNAATCALVIGQHPSAELHDTYIDVEPNTGMTMHAAKRLQANFRPFQLHVNATTRQKVKIGAIWYSNINSDLLLPMFWVEEYGEVPDSQASDFKNGVYLGQSLSFYIRYVVSIFGLFFFMVGILMLHCAVNRAQIAGSKSLNQSFLETEPVHAGGGYTTL